MNQLLTLFNMEGIYCDALANDDEGCLIFASFWGRDTALQEFLARLTLPKAEHGISNLLFMGQLNKDVSIGDPNRLDKLTGRMPKANIFGDMAHLMLFDKLVQAPDFVNQKGFLLIDGRQKLIHPLDQIVNGDNTWQLFKSICHLPMLDKWRDKVITLLQTEKWLKLYSGHRASVIVIDLPDIEFEGAISQMIIDGDLTI
ncbi:MAG: hypothetical protein ABL903_18060 [Methylococcales bacterium]